MGIFDATRKISLVGKQVLITGGNCGIGFETAKELCIRGARVVIGCRNQEKMDSAINIISEELKSVTSPGSISGQILDLQSFESVRKASQELHEKFDNIDICILNAGIMRVPLKISEGLELQHKVNHFSHFLLLNGIFDLIEKSQGRPRVIAVSSAAHKAAEGKMNYWRTFGTEEDYKKEKLLDPAGSFVPYGESKLANICHMQKLAKLKPNIGCFSLHPGVVKTELGRTWKANSPTLFFFTGPILGLFSKSTRDGAQTSIYCAIAEELEKPEMSGKYFADCKETNVKHAYSNPDLAEKLWKISEEVTQSSLS